MTKRQALKNTWFIFSQAAKINKRFLICKLLQILAAGLQPAIHLWFLQQLLDLLSLPQHSVSIRQLGLPLFFFGVLQLCFFLGTKQLQALLPGETTMTVMKLRSQLAEAASHLPYSELETAKVQDLIELAAEMRPFTQAIDLVSSMLTEFLVIVSLSALISSQNGWLLLFLLLIVFLRLQIDERERRSRSYWREKFAPIARRYSYFINTIESPEFGAEVRVQQLENLLDSQLQKTTTRYQKALVENYREIQKNNLLIDGLLLLQELLMYLLLGVDVLARRLSIGSFAMVATGIKQYTTSLLRLARDFSELINQGRFVAEYKAFVTRQPKIAVKTADCTQPQTCSIVFENVSFTYPNDSRAILKNISFSLKANQSLSLVGVNGAGKTTLVKLLCGLYAPTAGYILLNGRKTTDYSEAELAAIFSAVFQDHRLLAFSIRETITGGGGASAALESALQKSGAAPRIAELPLGIDTPITKEFSEDGQDFSGGERQKLSLAKMIYQDTPVMILDEPTASLDPQAEFALYQNFAAIIQDKTAIYISHRLSSTRFTDHIAVLDQGELVEFGSHEQLVKQHGLYSQLFAKQAAYYR